MAASSVVQQGPFQQVKLSLPDDGGKRFLVRRWVHWDTCLPEGFLQSLVQGALPRPPPCGPHRQLGSSRFCCGIQQKDVSNIWSYQVRIRNGTCNCILKSRKLVEKSSRVCLQSHIEGWAFSVYWFGRRSVERWELCLAIYFPVCKSLWSWASSPISLGLGGLNCEVGWWLHLLYRVVGKSEVTAHIRHGEQCLGHSKCQPPCCKCEHTIRKRP